ncbi:MAG: hypothetical protein ACFN06_02480 [Limosilactobacillus oris]
MKKKLWITISILALLGLWAIVYIPYNLKEYNFYYATHMKRKSNQYQFIPALGRSKLPNSYLPDTQILSIEERDQSINKISQSNILKHGDQINIYWDFIAYRPAKQDGGSKNTKLIFIDNYGNVEKGSKKEMTNQLSNYLDQIQVQIKHHSEKPGINLQSLYNYKYN